MRPSAGDGSRRVYTYRGKIPAWLLLLLAPFGVLFLLSLTAALVVGGVAALVLPLLWRGVRNVPADRPRGDHSYIELDPSDYRRVDGPDRED
jgi:hypothetical protein